MFYALSFATFYALFMQQAGRRLVRSLVTICDIYVVTCVLQVQEILEMFYNFIIQDATLSRCRCKFRYAYEAYSGITQLLLRMPIAMLSN